MMKKPIEVTNHDKKQSYYYDDMGSISDGCHTFNELYHYRALYNAGFFNELARNGQVTVYKSRVHDDGEPCFGGGWFVVVADLPTGQITNHYEDKYWELFKISHRKPQFLLKYDGHTPQEAADRLEKYLKEQL